MMQYIKQKEDKQFIFLTLTTPNVTVEHLEDEIKNYNRRLSNRKHFKSIAKGYVRKLEITYNKKRDDYNDYNPHFHVLIAVNKSYFI